VAEVAVGVTTEMPIIQWTLLHQVMVDLVNIHLSCRSHLLAPACLMAQEDLQWAEGSRKTLAMPLSGIVLYRWKPVAAVLVCLLRTSTVIVLLRF
jgi:hypothetical protein